MNKRPESFPEEDEGSTSKVADWQRVGGNEQRERKLDNKDE